MGATDDNRLNSDTYYSNTEHQQDGLNNEASVKTLISVSTNKLQSTVLNCKYPNLCSGYETLYGTFGNILSSHLKLRA